MSGISNTFEDLGVGKEACFFEVLKKKSPAFSRNKSSVFRRKKEAQTNITASFDLLRRFVLSTCQTFTMTRNKIRVLIGRKVLMTFQENLKFFFFGF